MVLVNSLKVSDFNQVNKLLVIWQAPIYIGYIVRHNLFTLNTNLYIYERAVTGKTFFSNSNYAEK